MSGFFHYFLSTINPAYNFGFSAAIGELMQSQYYSWWAIFIIPFLTAQVPPLVVWIVYFFKPNAIRPVPSARPGQVEPLISVVIAGRNESATIGQCIKGALLCGYSNLEVIFVDDCSDDDSVAIARRAALSVTRDRRDCDRVRIFPSPRRNGKASTLNIGIRMARGEYIAITDADSVIQYGCMQHWLLPFEDPRVGAVCANCRILNSGASLLTRLQEIEYALKFTLGRYTMARLGLLNIASGMGSLFRAEILHRLGGFDTGLGDDTDMTTNIRKQRWKLGFSLDAVVWTTVPETRYHLWRQRMRWRRNMIKIRISKHRDQFVLGRYGFANAVLAANLLLSRMMFPLIVASGLLIQTLTDGPLNSPQIVRSFYWIALVYLLVKMLIARDLARTPQPVNFCLIVFYPFYFLWLMGPLVYAELSELFRIGAKHPYVPDHIWEEIPWW